MTQTNRINPWLRKADNLTCYEVRGKGARSMDSTKYIGMDVHKEATTIAVMNSAGKLVMESIVETKAVTIVQFLEGLRGELYVTLEEGTWAAWLYDLLKPHLTKVVVCNPRKNALLKAGNKSDRIDARKLAECYVRDFYRRSIMARPDSAR